MTSKKKNGKSKIRIENWWSEKMTRVISNTMFGPRSRQEKKLKIYIKKERK